MKMDLHILKIIFSLMTGIIVIMGSLMNTMEPHLPSFLVQSYRFGKYSYQGKSSWLKPVQVPKRWFRHFYVFASVFSTFCCLTTLYVYVLSREAPAELIQLLDLVATEKRSFTVSSIATLVAMLLMTAQCIRRFYETWCISIFSDSKMDFSHYIVGFTHYFGSICAILAESPGFTSHVGVSPLVMKLQLSELRLYHYLAILTFIWAFIHQYRAAVILANLRCNKSGGVVSKEHHIPEGDWFEIVSSPHMLSEVMMYLSLMVVLWGSSVFPYVAIWVLCNQVENALLTHWWYQTKFKEYPQQRRAIIPYIL